MVECNLVMVLQHRLAKVAQVLLIGLWVKRGVKV
jgi:hypothetical protein